MERCREKERETDKRKLGRSTTVPNISNDRVRGNYPRATLGERSEEDRYINNGSMSPILANCVTTNICKLIRDTKSMVTGVQSPRRTDTTGPAALAEDLHGKATPSSVSERNTSTQAVFACVQIVNTTITSTTNSVTECYKCDLSL